MAHCAPPGLFLRRSVSPVVGVPGPTRPPSAPSWSGRVRPSDPGQTWGDELSSEGRAGVSPYGVVVGRLSSCLHPLRTQSPSGALGRALSRLAPGTARSGTLAGGPLRGVGPLTRSSSDLPFCLRAGCRRLGLPGSAWLPGAIFPFGVYTALSTCFLGGFRLPRAPPAWAARARGLPPFGSIYSPSAAFTRRALCAWGAFVAHVGTSSSPVATAFRLSNIALGRPRIGAPFGAPRRRTAHAPFSGLGSPRLLARRPSARAGFVGPCPSPAARAFDPLASSHGWVLPFVLRLCGLEDPRRAGGGPAISAPSLDGVGFGGDRPSAGDAPPGPW